MGHPQPQSWQPLDTATDPEPPLNHKGRPDAKKLFREGLRALDLHRENYGPKGPKRLRLLWWEFPRKDQDAIREGCRMNFLSFPDGELAENALINPE